MSTINNLQAIIANVQESLTSDNLQEAIAKEVRQGYYYYGDIRYFVNEEEMRKEFPELTNSYEVEGSLDFEVEEEHDEDYNKVTYARLVLRSFSDECGGEDVALLSVVELETTLICKD